MTFNEYLEKIHASNYQGTDDNMPEDFERWLSEKDQAEIMEYAETWGASQYKKGRKSVTLAELEEREMAGYDPRMK